MSYSRPCHFQCHDDTTFRSIDHFESLCFPVKLLQPRLRVRDSDALLPSSSGCIQAFAVITNLDPQSIIAPRRRNRDSTWSYARANPVAKRILNDGLQYEVRNRNVQDVGIDIDLNRQSILKADPFDFEIRLQEFNLAAQGYFDRT